MTQQDNDNVLQAAVELLNENGFEAYAQVLRILLDQAMKIKRRMRVAGLFPNERSLLRLVAALLMETDEDWQTGKRYLDMTVENDTPALQQKRIYRKNVA